MLAASMNNTSPPVPVTANPVAMPGVSVRSATSEWKRARPRYLRTSSVPIVVGSARSPPSTLGAPSGGGLPRSDVDDGQQGIVAKRNVRCIQTIALELPPDQVVTGYGKLFLECVAV